MILSTERIRAMMLDDSVPPSERLVITPVLDWKTQLKPGFCSIDVRLGQRFSVPRRTKLSHLDHLADDYRRNVENYKDDYHILMGDLFVLHPRQFILGETLEWVHLPTSLAAYVIGRSGWGRDGLIIATATGVHAGFSGILTLEITNLGEIPIHLYPGLTIAQLFIHQVEKGDAEPPVLSSFAGATSPSSGDGAGSDRTIIKRLRSSRGLDD